MPSNIVADMNRKSGFLELSPEHQSRGVAVSSSNLAIAIGDQVLFSQLKTGDTEITCPATRRTLPESVEVPIGRLLEPKVRRQKDWMSCRGDRLR